MVITRSLPIPLGEHTMNRLNRKPSNGEVDFQTSYEVPVKTPYSSGSSSSSSSSSSGSSSQCETISIDAASLSSSALSSSLTDNASAPSTKCSAFAERTNTTAAPLSLADLQSTPQSSPVKSRSRVPTLDAIAARMRKIDLSGSPCSTFNDAEQENDVRWLADNRPCILRSSSSALATPTQKRGRSEALASLIDRAAHRSRSTSPIKKVAQGQNFDDDGTGTVQPHARLDPVPSSGLKDVPSLQDIIKRMGNKRELASSTASSSAGSSPALDSPTPSAPRSPSRASAQKEQFDERPAKPSPTEHTKPESPAKLGRVKPNEHPLEHRWSMYFDSKAWNPASSTQSLEPKSPAPNATSWEATLKMLGQYDSVESFMTVFRTLRRPSQLERNSNYHLFKDGIKPMWEDSANVNGGKWVITLRGGNSALLDRSWMWLVLALIGEDLDEADDVTGAVVSTRAKGDRITLWIRDKNNVDLANKIGRRFISLLDLEREPGVTMEFTVNNHTASVVGDTSASSNYSLSSSRGSSTSESKYFSLSNPCIPAAHGNPVGGFVQRNLSTNNSVGANKSFLTSSPIPPHMATQQQNALTPTQTGSPIQMHGTLGAHLRLHGSPGKARTPITSTGTRRGSQDPSSSEADTSLTGLGFSMGLGAPIGRTSSPSPVKSNVQRPGFGLMNRSRLMNASASLSSAS